MSRAIGRLSAYGTVLSPLVFTCAWLALGALRPGYSQLSRQISDLGVGANGAAMNVAFVLGGLLLLGGALAAVRVLLSGLGLARNVTVAVLLGLPAVGMMLDGFCTERALAGHLLGALLGFFTPIAGFPIAGVVVRGRPQRRGLGTALLFAGLGQLAVVILFFGTGTPGAALGGLGIGGLTERVMVLHLQLWYAVLGHHAARRVDGKTDNGQARPVVEAPPSRST